MFPKIFETTQEIDSICCFNLLIGLNVQLSSSDELLSFDELFSCKNWSLRFKSIIYCQDGKNHKINFTKMAETFSSIFDFETENVHNHFFYFFLHFQALLKSEQFRHSQTCFITWPSLQHCQEQHRFGLVQHQGMEQHWDIRIAEGSLGRQDNLFLMVGNQTKEGDKLSYQEAGTLQ